MEQSNNDPLHGVTLQQVVTALVEHYGWEELGWRVDIRCFNLDPSISSSLKFLRKTPWARQKVEELYVRMMRKRRKEELAKEDVEARAAQRTPSSVEADLPKRGAASDWSSDDRTTS
jgi:uncharacterized protein (DUF2132 family)